MGRTSRKNIVQFLDTDETLRNDVLKGPTVNSFNSTLMNTFQKEEYRFKAELQKIGINPFVFVPDAILTALFEKAGKNKGPVPVCVAVNNGTVHTQTLIRFRGSWRLYINTKILPQSPSRIGELLTITICFNPVKELLHPHPKLTKALEDNPEALDVYNRLAPSLRNEIIKYLSFLKTDESIERNVERALLFLMGKGRFVGRKLPGKTTSED